MPERDELQFNIRLSERVSVEFALLKQDDGRNGVPYNFIRKNDTTITFSLDPSTFSSITEARRSIVDQARKQVAGGLTGDLDDAIDIAL
jgi:hypothetical protein